MTASDPAAIAHANAVRIWGDGVADVDASQRCPTCGAEGWCEPCEARLSAVAESVDYETGRPTIRLLPRKDWR